MKPSEVLKSALSRLDGGKKWIKKDFARDADGRNVYSASSRAACWCSYGAINSLNVDSRAADYLSLAIGGYSASVTNWNDAAPDFSVIQQGFEKAIQLAEAEGQ